MSEYQKQKQTVLYETHLSSGAKMAPFGGFLMPIQYEGIIKEHTTTREAVSIFDTCHMGEIRISGEHALQDLENLLTCAVGTMKIGQCRYGFLCNENGGVLDDQIVYRISESKFLMIVNAGTLENDYQWVCDHVSKDTHVTNVSDVTAKIDIQGPDSPPITNKILDQKIDDLKYYFFKYAYYKDTKVLVSRTGYTGEMGFEIYCPTDVAVSLWNDCLELGAKPAGLGCRDTLRLEMGFPLYGHELDLKRNPAEAGFKFAISSKKKFIGSEAILNPEHVQSRMVGMTVEGKRSARKDNPILSNDNKEIGIVTSGSFAPSLGHAIAMGYVQKEYAEPGTEINIDLGKQTVKATITELPFYKNATGRDEIAKHL